MSSNYISSNSSTYTESLRLRRTVGNFPHKTTGNYISHKKINTIQCIHDYNITAIGETDLSYFNVISDYNTTNMENCLSSIVYSYSTQPIYSKPPLISTPVYNKNKTIQRNHCMLFPTVRGIGTSRASLRRVCGAGVNVININSQNNCDPSKQVNDE